MKSKHFLFSILLFIFMIPTFAFAITSDYEDISYKIVGEEVSPSKINIYFFYGDGCPHCAKEEKFLDSLLEKYGDNINVYRYETWKDSNNKNYMFAIKALLKKDVNGRVPFTVIGKESFLGYNDYTGEKIENLIRVYLELDPEENLIVDRDKENIPLLGEVNVKEVSILLVAVILGLVDGFNPCAMWILLFLINMLIGMKSRKRMLLYGFVFLFTSALVYFLSMLGISSILSFISVPTVRSIIGLVALGVGAYNIYKFWNTRKEDAGCHVVDSSKRKKIFTKIKKFTSEKNIFIALVGIIALALSVNLVELACSTVFPATFSEILAVNNVDFVTRIFYLAVYTIFYMLDDMVVFLVAISTLTVTAASTKYGKYSSIVCGIIMIIMGILLIFKPEWVMFNF